MPDERTWEGFFEPSNILRQLQFQCGSEDVVDFGCGFGTFSLAAARLTTGTVHALDIDAQMIATLADRARASRLSNIRPIHRDFVAAGTGLPDSSVAYAMLFNILHAEDATGLLREAFRVLRPGGLLGIVHWIHDAATPRGPDLSIRPRPEQCIDWARQTGFVVQDPVIALPPYHYGLIARKPR